MRFLSSSSNTFSIECTGPEETELAGETAGQFLYPGLLLLLKGRLGMGKTKFIQGIGRKIGVSRIKSPSFIIMSEHEGRIPFLHADLYRLESQKEIESLAIEEYLDEGFAAAVEWGDRWTVPPEDRVDIDIMPAEGLENSRIITFSASGERASRFVSRVRDELQRMVEPE